ncbi:CpsD/CapB family tyrosine-protein kinase [Paenibacillus soyae]|uniref:non-specific protein-tyrosine kinase n=1 Tax=Paenibacillus soyae TaxID=2969249 RepID=A0A9X2SBM4_9BACL|nr:CpsD/CapB family tyrosine-protein kinase [Paenibacillus soyae]MCR2807396.1 CpsD/CapB family tyrosine-protein kinase [Paenibacillus soyae]
MSRIDKSFSLITHLSPKSSIAEHYRKLRTNIQYSSIDTPKKVLMVTSTKRNEGRTTTISNLAVTYALDGKKVLLLDADLRNPQMHQIFALSNTYGLTNVLNGDLSWQEAVHNTHIPGLSVMTCGIIPPNPSEMLGKNEMKQLITELNETYDYVLIDTPPLDSVADSVIVSSYCDGVIIVVLAGKVEKDRLKKAKNSLDLVHANILGVVLNGRDPKDVKGAV